MTREETGQWTKVKVTSLERTLNNLQRYRIYYKFQVVCSLSTSLDPSVVDKYGGRTPVLSIKGSKEPTLVVYVKNTAQKPLRDMVYDMRAKRESEVESAQESARAGGRAQRHITQERMGCVVTSFFYDFKKMGWDSKIVFPQQLDMYQCVGQCPFPLSSRHPHTTHAYMKAAMHGKFPAAIPAPCCVPKSFHQSTLVMNVIDSEFVFKSFDDLKVKSCECN